MPPKGKKTTAAKAAAAKAKSSPKKTTKTIPKTIKKPSSAPSTSKTKSTSPLKPTTCSSPAPESEEDLLPPKTPTKLKDKSQSKARAYQYYLLSRILANLIEIENQDRKGDGFYEEVADATRAVEASLIDLYNNGKVIDEWVHDGEEEQQEVPSPKKRASSGRMRGGG